jgi:hypothetical protein
MQGHQYAKQPTDRLGLDEAVQLTGLTEIKGLAAGPERIVPFASHYGFRAMLMSTVAVVLMRGLRGLERLLLSGLLGHCCCSRRKAAGDKRGWSNDGV